jgi:hypothetical protein
MKLHLEVDYDLAENGTSHLDLIKLQYPQDGPDYC